MRFFLTSFLRLRWLALAAALLIAAAPTVSRTLVETASSDAPSWVEMCTVGGLKVIDIASFSGEESSPTAPQHPMGEACGYCVLVTSVPMLLLLLVVLLLSPTAPTRLPKVASALRRVRNYRGLGSQAPPFAF